MQKITIFLFLPLFLFLRRTFYVATLFIFVFFTSCFVEIANITSAFAAESLDNKNQNSSLESQQNDISNDIQKAQIYKKLDEIIKMVDNGFYKEISSKEIYESLAKGLLSGIDQYSAYLTEDDFVSIKGTMMGKFAGIGAEITKDKGFIKVVSPIDDSPSYKAGLKTGDYIIKIDNNNVYEKSTYEVLKMLRGDAGSEVKLTIIRGDSPVPLEIIIKRDIINVVPIKSSSFGDILYIKIASFSENAFSEFLNAIQKNKTEKQKDPQAIIIDLRYNPGGEIEQCIMIADLFLSQNKRIVSVNGRNKSYFTVDKSNFEKFDTKDVKPSKIKIINEENEFIFKASKNTILPNSIPIVVLVNGGSASASEILTAALQQNNRAIIVGEKTFGKGSVQSIIPIEGGKQGAVKLTIAKYYTPNKTSIHEIGIMPDIIESEKPIAKKADGIENNLNQQASQQSSSDTDFLTQQNLTKDDYEKIKADNQLYVAYTIARANITQSKMLQDESNATQEKDDKPQNTKTKSSSKDSATD